jgi:hypothetical protein
MLAALSLAACGGGGGGGSVVPTAAPSGASTAAPTMSPTPMPTPTPTPTPLAVTGTAVELTSGTPLAGFTVTVGALPNASTCLTAQSATSMPCGVVASPLPTVTTSASGAFSIAVPAAGTYMLSIGKDTTYATLHRTLVATSSGLALGTVNIAALTTDEQAWLVDINHQRATVSFPTSFANLSIDEYAEEQARAEVAAIVSGAQPYGDATESLFANNYAAEPGAMYGATGVAALGALPNVYLDADSAWMGEKANCAGGNWQTCPFAENTGHYINLSNTANVWIGVGESNSSFNYMNLGQSFWAYAAIPIIN